MQLRGLHHVTAICRDLEATIAFYRDVLGLGDRPRRPGDDDPGTRHVWFGAPGRAPRARCSRSWSTRELPKGVVGVGSTHHFALVVESAEELEAWRDYLRGQEVECTDLYDRGAFRSVYLRDPDGHIVEIATRGPGFTPGPPLSRSRLRVRTRAAHVAERERVGQSRRAGARRAHAVGVRSSSRRSWSPTSGSRKEPPAAGPAPAMLAHEQIGDRHALGLPGALEHHVPDGDLPVGDLSLEFRPGQAYAIGLLESTHVLRRRHCRRCFH